MKLKKRIAATVFPRYSLTLDQVNNNARVSDWIRKNAGVPKLPDREAMYAYLNRQCIGAQAVDFLEFGVFQGASLSAWTKLHANPASRFYGFDSFIGLPENWGTTLSAGAFDLGGVLPNLSDSRITLLKGWFQDSLPPFLRTFEPRNLLVLHIDSDLHSSAMYVLTQMDSLIKPGAIVIFDEFSSALHEFRALEDYSRSYRRSFKPLAMTQPFADQAAFVVER